LTLEDRLVVLSAADVHALLDIDTAIATQQEAFEALAHGTATVRPRLLLEGQGDSVAFCYAARLGPRAGAVCKFGSVNPSNAGRGLATVSALITVLDGADGRPVAVMDGTSVTTVRTSAASAVAVRALATDTAETLAVIGSGVQAEAHVHAIARVRPIRSVYLHGRRREQAQALAERLHADLGTEVVACTTAEQAVRASDIVVACTTSTEPVVSTAWLRDGATVVSIGSFAPDRSEVALDLLVRAASIVVDDVATAMEHAGPVVQAIAGGVIGTQQLTGLGEVLLGAVPARRHDSDVVFYNSVGLGVQDSAAAAAVVTAAREQRRGVFVEL
jgi:ornithine cyclodeaminase/alanine dehydrogenase-like protein (mu-crystallin family)